MDSMSIEEQVEWFDREADAALSEVIELLTELGEVVKRRARLRLTSIGAADYGDASWRKDHMQLLAEWLDEAADQLVYGVMMRRLDSMGLADGLIPVKLLHPSE